MTLLDGKVVVITGAGSGVGRASARLFASEGARVVCADLRPQWGDETVRLVEAAGGTAIGVQCDVVVPDDVTSTVAAAVREFGRLDLVHLPAEDLPALHVHDKVQVEEPAADEAAQVRDVPRRHLPQLGRNVRVRPHGIWGVLRVDLLSP